MLLTQGRQQLQRLRLTLGAGGAFTAALLPRPCTRAGSGKRVAELLLLLLFGFEVKK